MSQKRSLRYSDLNAALIERIPELFAGYAELRAMWDGDEPGPHVIYGDLLVPYIAKLVGTTGSEITLLRTFALLEELAESEEQSIRDVLVASVLEGIHEDREVRNSSQEYMGPRTKALANDLNRASDD